MKSIVCAALAGLLAIAAPVFADEPEWLQRLDRSCPETVAEQAARLPRPGSPWAPEAAGQAAAEAEPAISN